MKIQNSEVRFAAHHAERTEETRQESTLFWVGDRPADTPDASSAVNTDRLFISAQAATLLKEYKTEAPSSYESESLPIDPKLRAMQRILEMLTGEKISISSFAPLGSETPTPGTDSSVEDTGPEQVGWGLEYDATVSRTKHEESIVSATGSFITTDGLQVDFLLHLEMRGHHTEESKIQIREGDARLIDPLILNFNGTAAELSDFTFSFDLDGDGSEEAVPFAGKGSGFLVLDKNQDNMVNNGLELFGPSTNNGFNELAAFDADGNGWIDEADPVFDKLRIWSRNAAGSEELQSLGERGVGAFFLGRADSPFTLYSNGGNAPGVIRETGLFLNENGTLGVLQEIDIAV